MSLADPIDYTPNLERGYVILYYSTSKVRAWAGPDKPTHGTLNLHKVPVYKHPAAAVAVLRQLGRYTDIRYRITSVAKARKILANQSAIITNQKEPVST